MITRRLYEKLDAEERKLWHSHDYEVGFVDVACFALLCYVFVLASLSLAVFPSSTTLPFYSEYVISLIIHHNHDSNPRKVKSGMLILPNPTVPDAVWTVAETEEMKEVIGLYGKTFHFWQTDRGDELPLGMPVLMGSFTADDQVCWGFCFLGCWEGKGE